MLQVLQHLCKNALHQYANAKNLQRFLQTFAYYILFYTFEFRAA